MSPEIQTLLSVLAAVTAPACAFLAKACWTLYADNKALVQKYEALLREVLAALSALEAHERRDASGER